MTRPELHYRPEPGWEQLPAGRVHADVPDVAVDSADRVYLLTRRDSAVLVYAPDGAFLRAWGSDVLSPAPHGITIGPNDVVYIVDEEFHSVRAYSTEGEHLFDIGPSGTPSDTGADPSIPAIYDRIASIARAAGPFNRPTKLSVAHSGQL
jgi:hypothetical protein